MIDRLRVHIEIESTYRVGRVGIVGQMRINLILYFVI